MGHGRPIYAGSLLYIPTYTFVDCFLQVAVDVNVLTDLHEYTRHAGILANRNISLFCNQVVFMNDAQDVLCQIPWLSLFTCVDLLLDILGR